MDSAAALREENESLKKEVEALLLAKEIAKEKVRSAIQELVDENKKLKKKITTIEAQVSSLLAERNALLQRIGAEGGEPDEANDTIHAKVTAPPPPQYRRLHSFSSDSNLPLRSSAPSEITRSFSAENSSERLQLRGSVDGENPSGANSLRGRRQNVQSASKLAGLLGLDEDKIVTEMQNVPDALTIEEPGLVMMRNAQDELVEVKGGTLVKLVERLYNPTVGQQSPEFVSTFLLTQRCFASTISVLPLLVNAYMSFSENKNGNQEQRQRILKVLDTWAELMPEDFQTLGEYETEFRSFLKSSVPSIDGAVVAKALRKRIKHPQQEDVTKQRSDSNPKALVGSPRMASKRDLKAPKAILPKARISGLEDIDPVELARQLTLLDQEIFQRIRPFEFLNTAWMKKTKEVDAPNILKMIHRFNEVSLWVQHSIVSCDTARKRALLIEKFIKVGRVYLKLNNFNGVMQIISALEGAAVYRLAKSFEKVKPKSKKKYANMHELMSATLSYKLYREALNTCTPPCIPYLGVHLTDFATIFETQKANLAPKYPAYLNFTKSVQVATGQRMIMRFQAVPYALQSVGLIREWTLNQLAAFGATPEEKLYELSLTAEPREEAA